MGRESKFFALALSLICCCAGRTAAQNPLRFELGQDCTIERVAAPPLVEFPMFAAFDDRGRLFVAESSGLDLYAELQNQTRKCRIKLLEDNDEDGVFESAHIWADELVFPMGLAWREGKLFVADPPDLIALEDEDGDGTADRREVVLTGFGHQDNGSLHGLIFGPDGRLYLTMGSPDGYRLSRPDGTVLSGESGALICCWPDGADPEVLARGFVNLVEVAFSCSGIVIGTDNWFQEPHDGKRDALVHITAGGLYPYYPDTGARYPVLGAPLPAIALLPAVAHSGLTHCRSFQSAAGAVGDFVSAQHNTRAVVRHRLVANGTTFRSDDVRLVAADSPDFRPSDVLEDSDGSLLVIDTGSWYVQHCPTGMMRDQVAKGGIYRLRSTAAQALEDPWGRRIAWDEQDDAALVTLLGDDRLGVNDRAATALVRRGPHVVDGLRRLLADRRLAIAQRAAWALCQIPAPSADAALASALSDDRAELVATCARALGARPGDGRCPDLARLLEHPDAHVRLAAAEALATRGSAADSLAVLSALRQRTDRFLEHALFHALYQSGDSASLREAMNDPSPLVQRAALMIWEQRSERKGALNAASVFERLSAADAELRTTAVWVLARHPEWASQSVEVLERALIEDEIAGDRVEMIRNLVRSFSDDDAFREWLAQAIVDDSLAAERRAMLLASLRDSGRPLHVDYLPALRQLIIAADTALKHEALRSVAHWRVTDYDDLLAAMVDDVALDDYLRLLALRAIVARQKRLSEHAFRLLESHLAVSRTLPERIAALELISSCQLSADQLDRYLNRALNDPLIPATSAVLVATQAEAGARPREWGKYLLHAFDRGWRPTEAILQQALDRLPADSADQRALLRERFELQNEALKRRLESYRPLLTGGDVDRGRELFFGTRVACGGCHAVKGNGASIGPDLSAIGGIRAADDLLESVVVPSSTIAQGFEQYALTTTSGTSHMGQLVKRADGDLAIRDALGQEQRFRGDEVDALEPLSTSLMPEGLERLLSEAEFRDLFAYLQSLK